jgi:DNA-binding XRE family transcriptional regulator
MFAEIHRSNYEDFEAELLNDPSIAREYNILKPKYEMIRTIIRRRNKLRMSQAQLAKRAGMKQPAIARLETGTHNTTLNTFFRVTQALDLDISFKTRKQAR